MPGLTVVLHCGGGSFKSQMKRADASGARFAVIVGEDGGGGRPGRGQAAATVGRAGERQRDAGRTDGARAPGAGVDTTTRATKDTSMYDLEEQEQIDALKAWWRQHGRLLIVAAVAAIAAAGRASAGGASTRTARQPRPPQLYAALEKAVRANDVKQVQRAGRCS